MDNLISKCHVIQSLDYGVEPIIYLNLPEITTLNEQVVTFPTIFHAKWFINFNNKNSHRILVTKAVTSQLWRTAIGG